LEVALLLKRLSISAVAFSLWGGAVFAAPGPDETYVAETDYGKVKGNIVTEKVIRFAGIPYAKEPVGGLRFKPPLDPDPWEAVLDATEFGLICIQPVLDEEFTPAELQSEDCLRLNVWTQGLGHAARALPGGALDAGRLQGARARARDSLARSTHALTYTTEIASHGHLSAQSPDAVHVSEGERKKTQAGVESNRVRS
jgi:carboxylesterase type B